MLRQISDVEQLLKQLVIEHQKLLAHVEAHQAAMRTLDLRAMDDIAKMQEACRIRIAGIETRRRGLVQQIAAANRLAGIVKVDKLAELFPERAPTLLALREQLHALANAIAAKNATGSRLAGALLGHMNTAVRMLAGVVERAGVYTRDGVPRVSSRIGAMEALG